MIKLDIFDTDDSIFESGLRDDAYGVIELGLGVEGAVNPDIDDSELIDDDPDDTGDLEGEDVVAGVDDDPDPEESEDDDYDDAVDDALVDEDDDDDIDIDAAMEALDVIDPVNCAFNDDLDLENVTAYSLFDSGLTLEDDYNV